MREKERERRKSDFVARTRRARASASADSVCSELAALFCFVLFGWAGSCGQRSRSTLRAKAAIVPISAK